MKMLTENELCAVVGGEVDTPSWPGVDPTQLDYAQLQRLLDSAAAQQNAAYDAWIRSLLDSMAP